MTDDAPNDLQQAFDAALNELPFKRRQFVREYLKDLNGTKAAIRAGYSERTASVQASQILSILKVAVAVRAGLAAMAMPADEVLARLSMEARGSMGDFLRVDQEEIFIETSIAVLTDNERFLLTMGGGQAVRDLLASSSSIADEDISGTSDTSDSTDTTDIDDEEPKELPKAVMIRTATVKRAVARLDLLAAEDKLHLIREYKVDEKGAVSIKLYDAQVAKKLLGQHHGLFVERHEVSGAGGKPVPVSFVTVVAEPMPESDDDDDQ